MYYLNLLFAFVTWIHAPQTMGELNLHESQHKALLFWEANLSL